MKAFYVLIALLVAYGDLLKRYVPAGVSLAVLYGLAIALLLGIAFVGSGRRATRIFSSAEAQLMTVLATLLTALYGAQIFTSGGSFVNALTHAIYMAVPLLYIVVIHRYWPDFDLAQLGQIFLVLMIPANLVGLIQNFLNPTFFISIDYGESGGVILRNLISGGAFARYPAIYASADRYSAMALMQLYFTFVVLIASGGSVSHRTRFWIGFNFISAVAALFIAGARSRILIAGVILGLTAITVVARSFLSIGRRSSGIFVGLAIAIVTIYAVVTTPNLDGSDSVDSAFPVVGFLQESFAERDISQRIEQAASYSLNPTDLTVFGQGLGTSGDTGKPGEFGIKSMWVESGILWTSLMLLAFAGILSILSFLTYNSILSRPPIEVAMYATPPLVLVMALLTGLTAAFELSSGLLLGCAIAANTRSAASRDRPRALT